MNTLFDVAVIGAGVMGMYHARNYAALSTARLVGIVDPDPQRQQLAESEFGCPAYASVEELLAVQTPHAASIATPTSLHFSVSKQLLNAGVHLLVEKPVTTDLHEAHVLADLSSAVGKVLQVGHITRFYNSVQQLKREVDTPLVIEARRSVPSTRIQDVGVILDLMIHDIDIALSLVDADPVHLTANGTSINGNGLEDIATAEIRFADNTVARFFASRLVDAPKRDITVIEKDRTLKLDFTTDPDVRLSIAMHSHDNGEVLPPQVRIIQEHNPLQTEIAHFLSRIGGDVEPIGTLEDDLRSLALANMIIEELNLASAQPKQSLLG